MRILVVEDDSKIADMLRRLLRTEGYAVDVARDGIEAQEIASLHDHDVILLDVLMPRQDGRTTCARLREQGLLTPILMLTALSGVEDRIAGIDLGADDYLAKPFHPGELLARVRALARRRSDVRSVLPEKFGIRLDLSAHRAWREGREISLTAKEFALLELFMMNPGRVLSRERISGHLWDMNFDPSSNVIESFVRFLRRKIDDGFSVRLIQTVRGVGYRLSDQP